MTAPASETATLRSIATNFAHNVQALRVFANTIATHADAHDTNALEEFQATLDAIIPPQAKVAFDQPVENPNKVGEPSAPILPGTDVERSGQEALKKAFQDPANWRRFLAAVKSMSKAAPIQGPLLRASAIVTLMSYVEALIADLVHLYYRQYPAALPGDERSITLADLRAIGSVAEAEQLLVSKEVDSLLRETLENQLGYFKKRPKVDLRGLEPFKDRLIELDQRRNLLVHNRGLVNRIYLDRVHPALVSEFQLKEGDEAGVSAEYLAMALDLVETCGTILAQQCWRKWDGVERGEADRMLSHFIIYEALQDGRHRVVTQLASFALEMGMQDEATTRIVCVNKAIAHRALGDVGAADATIDALDWSACGLNFRVALNAVKGKERECLELIPKAVAAGELAKDDLDVSCLS